MSEDKKSHFRVGCARRQRAKWRKRWVFGTQTRLTPTSKTRLPPSPLYFYKLIMLEANPTKRSFVIGFERILARVKWAKNYGLEVCESIKLSAGLMSKLLNKKFIIKKAVLRNLLATLACVNPLLRCLYRHSRFSLTFLIAKIARTILANGTRPCETVIVNNNFAFAKLMNANGWTANNPRHSHHLHQ